MVWFKRIGLFLITNILVMVTISLMLNLLGFHGYMTARGLDTSALMVFCFVWGMGGAFISLALSRVMAKMLMGVQVIDPARASGVERQLIDLVHRLARQAQLPGLPQVGIYNNPEMNAFATGPTKRRALVAVSSGLLSSMSMSELEGVLGHEISHVANGDMVTLTLIQGIVNAFSMYIARVIAWGVTQNMREEGRYMVRMLITIVMEILLTILGSMVVAYFSRWREFRADAGGARLAGRGNMVSALRRLQSMRAPVDTQTAPQFQAFKISGSRSGNLAMLFATHPPLEERIQRLETMNVGA